MVNIIQAIRSYAADFNPVKDMSDIPRFIYTLRVNDDFELANCLDNWYCVMLEHIQKEFNLACNADS